ncbi:restriction endonuclease subunit S [Pseudomonas sp. URMO17WK12:I11]|uniref:restriction endonuclease subunit S n=1 Tax=Pseudomonas sp. URMO17WK12:I11 TaxID=1283291 RepID=UPI0011A5F83C|nr:restriction endonuclease subunit S [Pseudomonas sp. URMO17WK12:I11]
MSTVLTDNLPLLAGAPNGIKKLRELILELAVRGKLVPQDPSDEPASELLKRIAEEKARLVAEGKIKKAKATQEELAEVSYEIPSSWAVAALGQVVEIVRGITFPASEKSKEPESGRVACLRTANVQDEIEWDDLLYIRESFVSRNDQYVEPHDIVMSMANSRELVGKVALIGSELKKKTTFGGFLGVLRPVLIEPRFVMALLRTPHARSILIDSASQTTNIANVSLAKLRPLPFAIPPLAEQHRIVAKVDELMALCNRLEARQADADSAHAQLVQALLSSLTQASDAEDFAQSWQRLAEHFHTLFTTESSIDALKQTLLQLAVMGKLVPQDPSDEPASELLKRIAEEKTRLISEEGLRTTARDDVPEAEHYFRLHTGWASCRLGNLARFIDYRGRTPTKTSSGVPLITAKNVRPGFISRDPQEFIADTDYLSWMTRGFPRVGDMLFTTEAPMGNVAIIDIAERFALAQRVICFQLHELETGPFLKLALMSSGFQAQLSDAATGMTATGIKSSRLKEIPVPIPPLAEQHRIVAKVDELMALCDQLKARLNQARQVHEHLASALVEQAVA